jgi:hypothetical protein
MEGFAIFLVGFSTVAGEWLWLLLLLSIGVCLVVLVLEQLLLFGVARID